MVKPRQANELAWLGGSGVGVDKTLDDARSFAEAEASD